MSCYVIGEYLLFCAGIERQTLIILFLKNDSVYVCNINKIALQSEALEITIPISLLITIDRTRLKMDRQRSTWTTRLRSSLVKDGRCHARRRNSAVCNERGRPRARTCNGSCTLYVGGYTAVTLVAGTKGTLFFAALLRERGRES